jgi:hypothetical protein
MADENMIITEDAIKKIVIDAMEYHWNDFVGDTYSLPDDYRIIKLQNEGLI